MNPLCSTDFDLSLSNKGTYKSIDAFMKRMNEDSLDTLDSAASEEETVTTKYVDVPPANSSTTVSRSNSPSSLLLYEMDGAITSKDWNMELREQPVPFYPDMLRSLDRRWGSSLTETFAPGIEGGMGGAITSKDWNMNLCEQRVPFYPDMLRSFDRRWGTSLTKNIKPGINSQIAKKPLPPKKGKKRPRAFPLLGDEEYVTPTKDDVLTGRGGYTNQNPGNKRYREDLENQKVLYRELGETREEVTGKLLKTYVAEAVVVQVKTMGGRFLDKDLTTGRWYVMSDSKAREKAAQALRTNETKEDRRAKRMKCMEKKKKKNEKTKKTDWSGLFTSQVTSKKYPLPFVASI